MTARAAIGLVGKHPAFGDFLRTGLTAPVADGIETWLDATLPTLRSDLAADWPTTWDAAMPLRFWVGRAVLGRTLAGVLSPSADRVGRRFPLLVLAEGCAIAPPMTDPNQAFWDALEAHIQQMRPGKGAATLLAGLTVPVAAETDDIAAQGPTIWAHHTTGSLAQLLAAAGPQDETRAQLARSYWWRPGNDSQAPLWLGCDGFPDASELRWLLTGLPRDSMAPEETRNAE